MWNVTLYYSLIQLMCRYPNKIYFTKYCIKNWITYFRDTLGVAFIILGSLKYIELILILWNFTSYFTYRGANPARLMQLKCVNGVYLI